MSVGFCETKIHSKIFGLGSNVSIQILYIFWHICGSQSKLTIRVFFFCYLLTDNPLLLCVVALARIDDLISFKASYSQLCEP